MFNPAIKILELKRDLEEIPRGRLAEVDQYLKSLLSKKTKRKNLGTLRGIWANKGFEKIVDVEKEIALLRKEVGDYLLTKKL
jgi:hypothetical protein